MDVVKQAERMGALVSVLEGIQVPQDKVLSIQLDKFNEKIRIHVAHDEGILALPQAKFEAYVGDNDFAGKVTATVGVYEFRSLLYHSDYAQLKDKFNTILTKV